VPRLTVLAIDVERGDVARRHVPPPGARRSASTSGGGRRADPASASGVAKRSGDPSLTRPALRHPRIARNVRTPAKGVLRHL